MHSTTNPRRRFTAFAGAVAAVVALPGVAGAAEATPIGDTPVPLVPASGSSSVRPAGVPERYVGLTTAPETTQQAEIDALGNDGSPQPVAAVAAAFVWHSRQAGGGANQPKLIDLSGGNNARQILVMFDQNTSRDVGVWGVGTKTVASTGVTGMKEVTNSAVAPTGGILEDQNTCTAPGITGLSVGLPAGVNIQGGANSATQTWSGGTGTSLDFKRHYNNTFQCRAQSAVAAKSTRRSIGEMSWKNGSVRVQTTDASFWW